jgi:hypothetical protein
MERTRAVCTRGHIVTRNVTDIQQRRALDMQGYYWNHHEVEIDRFCQECGSAVLMTCPQCDGSIPNPPGDVFPRARPFCGGCGAPFPWASRAERVGQLVTLLDQESLDDVTRLAAVEAINELAAAAPDDEEAQVESSKRIRDLTGRAWSFMEPVVQTLLTGAAKERLGLP